MMAATVLGRWIQANTCHLWISCTALMLFSAPIFWGFFEFFYHKKVSQYCIINLRKSFFLSSLLSFLGIFLFFLFYSHNYENRANDAPHLLLLCSAQSLNLYISLNILLSYFSMPNCCLAFKILEYFTKEFEKNNGGA